ncbi:PREDICTED: uncharacterized protein LOC109467529 [Branchiostoma belcheri]|uniref:Uncharacterized protein LOC109467529 n=1 Tax=Branchiostoma belcheri TaxID=7741 RepID=A0A6P4YV11_BRABE|nr:PREDICTED: uncharacterized protein LOC109467529 [Branchiostoma belcheri]
MKLVVALLVCCLVVVSGQGPDPEICDPNPTNPGPALPELPPMFQVRVEANIVEKNYTMVQHEFYDYPNNRGALMSYGNGSRRHEVYDYATLERFTIFDNGTCLTSNMSTSRFNFFSYHMEHGHAHINKAGFILHFGAQFNETYNGTTTVRGIPVNHWYSCMHNSTWNSTYKLDFYFSVPGYQTASGQDQIPVRAEIRGKRLTFNPQTKGPSREYKSIHHIYDFQGFHSRTGHRDMTWVYQTEGVVCPGRVNTKPVPSTPLQFYAEVEMVNMKNQTVQYMREYFDYNSKLFRVDFHPTSNRSRKWSFGPVQHKAIHDYNSGLEYLISYQPENCTIRPISNYSFDADIDASDHTKVHMKTSYEMFHFDDKDFTYSGVSRVRDIQTDVWVSREVNYHVPQGSKYSTDFTYQWYFSAENWTSTTRGSVNQSQVPIRLSRKGTWQRDDSSAPHESELVFNMFNFDSGEQHLWHFDVSLCFKEPNMQKGVFFQVPALYNDLISGDKYRFYRAVQAAVAEAAGIHALRVTEVWHTATDGPLWVGATLLEHPKVKGDSVEMTQQKPLETAFSDFKQRLDANALVIRFAPDPSRGQEVYLTALPGSLETSKDFITFLSQKNKPSNTYRPGTVAGIAIGTTLLGALIGVGGAWFMWKYRLQDVPYGTQT